MAEKSSRPLQLLLAVCFATVLIAPTRSRAQAYTNLALEGGGIRGIAYAGAFEALDKRGALDSIRQIAGTSVGAIAGCLLGVGYSPAEIRDIMFRLRIEHFNDGGWWVFGGQQRMRRRFGWYQGDAMERWIEGRIAARTGRENLSFGELHRMAESDARYKDLFITASNLSRQEATVFSWRRHPDMVISTAVRASMSIPLYFEALRLDSSGRKSNIGDVFVDGGLVLNYPLAIFDIGEVSRRTLGLKLERPEQIPHYEESTTIAPFAIHDFRSYAGALYNLTIETLNRKAPMEDELFRTIYISTAGINPKIRKMGAAQKTLLYESGRRAVAEFFQRSRVDAK